MKKATIALKDEDGNIKRVKQRADGAFVIPPGKWSLEKGMTELHYDPPKREFKRSLSYDIKTVLMGY